MPAREAAQPLNGEGGNGMPRLVPPDVLRLGGSLLTREPITYLTSGPNARPTGPTSDPARRARVADHMKFYERTLPQL
jgi:hypothetical protein